MNLEVSSEQQQGQLLEPGEWRGAHVGDDQTRVAMALNFSTERAPRSFLDREPGRSSSVRIVPRSAS